VRIGETPVKVSGKEYALLGHLAADPARVFTKE
jgi:DNA-binding response OmpR family regulator